MSKALNEQAQLVFTVSDSVWQLSGHLTLFLISQQWRQLLQKFPETGEWIVDCSHLELIDTAGLAFLLELMNLAIEKKLNLNIRNLPSAAKTLIQVNGVESLFESLTSFRGD